MALVNVETLSQGFKGFGGLPALRQVGLLILLAASVALGVGIAMWSQEADYGLLFTSTDPGETVAVVDALEQLQIPYRLDRGTGAVEVPDQHIHRMRLELAKRGLPKGSGTTGFEILEREQEFGTSKMLESARHNRALEGELARSIATLQTVRSARVHVARPKRSVFVREQSLPTASVIVDLLPGAGLRQNDITGIVHLVAASVPELLPPQVTVVDQRGRLLTKDPGEDEFSGADDRFAYTRRIENAFADRIISLLSPIVGVDGIRAQVNAEVDFTRIEKSTENYRPDERAVRSEQLEETANGNGGPQGIPGALSNQPPPAGVTANTPPGSSGEGGSVSNSKSTVRNYELDRTLSHTRLSPGDIRRLSVAVVVNHRRVEAEDGTVTHEPLEDTELEQLTSLVKQAVGFVEERGDQVTVSNTNFLQLPEELVEETPIWQQAWIWRLGRQLLGPLMVLVLLFTVLRPAVRNLSAVVSEPESEPDEQGALPPGEEAPKAIEDMTPRERAELENQQAEEELQMLEGEEGHEHRVDSVRDVVKENPARAAQVVKEWLSEDG